MKDIAEHLGMSRCTVSHVLNNNLDKYKYAPETVERVRAAAKEMGYVMNTVARSLKTNRTGTIAVVVADITNPFYTDFIREIEHTSYEKDTALIICASDENIEKENNILRMLNSRQIDGLVISPVSYKESIRGAYPFPIVQFDRKAMHGDFPYVGIDNRAAAEKGTGALFAQGCLSPVFIGTNSNDFSVMERLAGFRNVYAEKGTGDDAVVLDVLNSDEAYEKTLGLIESGQAAFDSVFASTHFLTPGIAAALVNAGYNVKAVTGFDACTGIPFFPWKTSIIRQPLEDMADKAFEILQCEISGEHSTQEYIVDVELVKY